MRLGKRSVIVNYHNNIKLVVSPYLLIYALISECFVRVETSKGKLVAKTGLISSLKLSRAYIIDDKVKEAT